MSPGLCAHTRVQGPYGNLPGDRLSPTEMLVIRPQQFARFEEYLRDEFVDQCANYVVEWHPAAAARYVDRTALREFTARCIERGKALGFRDQAHLRTLLDWNCEFGEGFEDEPRWEWLRSILASDFTPSIRIHRVENRLRILRERGDL